MLLDRLVGKPWLTRIATIATRLVGNPWLTRIATIATIVTAVLVMVLYTKIDSIVNGDLYSFNLRLDPTWYNPYYALSELSYVCLGVLAFLNAAILGLSFMKKAEKTTQVSTAQVSVKQPSFSTQEVKVQQTVPREKPKAKTRSAKGNTCPNCDKSFTTPLVTLNFVNGKPVMVNTCPYCNEPIGKEEKENMPDADVQIADAEKKEVR